MYSNYNTALAMLSSAYTSLLDVCRKSLKEDLSDKDLRKAKCDAENLIKYSQTFLSEKENLGMQGGLDFLCAEDVQGESTYAGFTINHGVVSGDLGLAYDAALEWASDWENDMKSSFYWELANYLFYAVPYKEAIGYKEKERVAATG